MFDNYTELAAYVRRFAEFGLMDNVLAESLSSQLGSGIIIKKFPFWKVQLPCIYNSKTNQIIINDKVLPLFTSLLRSINPLKDPKERFKDIFKSDIGRIIGGICYYGVHLYNMNNRGALIKEDYTKNWYKKFFNNSIYAYTRLTTISQRASEMWTIPYLNIIVNYFEINSYSGNDYTSGQEKKLDYMIDQFNDKIKDSLRKWNFDNQSMSIYGGWFKDYMSDFKLFFRNRSGVLVNLDQQFMDNQIDDHFDSTIYTVSLEMLNASYNSLPNTNYEHDRYPAAPFRELYVTAEPMAQWVNSLVRQNKLKQSDEKFQLFAARGLAYLGNHN